MGQLPVLTNSYNRCKKILKISSAGETRDQAVTRLSLRREYKKALCVHKEHICNETTLRLQELDEDISNAAIARRSQKSIEAKRVQYDAMMPYGRGLKPTNNLPLQRIEDVEPK
jgi:hypothetical protein